MSKVGNKIFLGIGLLLIGGFLLLFLVAVHRTPSLPAWNPATIFQEIEDEFAPGHSCTVKDETGAVVTITSRRVSPGDEIFTAEGRHYRVKKVKGNTAYATFIGMDKDILAYDNYYSRLESPATTVARITQPVGIYHTHSDESYVPTDGTESIPFRGGIYQVGQALANKLKVRGARVSYDKTPHDPHDNNAYYRSRRTAARLMKSNPIALFDIHRDGVGNPEFYQRVISNQDVSQMRLVVGRENPRMSANLDFAKRLMAYANQMHWPIAKEIFLAQGNYNQDLMPTALLIEAGTYTNSKDQAERGIALLADAVPVVLGITGPGTRPGVTEYNKPLIDPTARHPGGWAALAWIIGLTLLGGGAFLLISSGGWNAARDRLSRFFAEEFPGAGKALRLIRTKRQNNR